MLGWSSITLSRSRWDLTNDLYIVSREDHSNNKFIFHITLILLVAFVSFIWSNKLSFESRSKLRFFWIFSPNSLVVSYACFPEKTISCAWFWRRTVPDLVLRNSSLNVWPVKGFTIEEAPPAVGLMLWLTLFSGCDSWNSNIIGVTTWKWCIAWWRDWPFF